MPTSQNRNKAFTLLELLIAMAIFAVLAGIVYSGLKQFADSFDAIDNNAKALSEIQKAVAFLENDLVQLATRSYRNDVGSFRPAAVSGGREIEFLRLGFPILDKTAIGSEIIRVKYELTEKTLIRKVWRFADSVSVNPSFSSELAANISGLDFSFYNKGKWVKNWPDGGNEIDLNNNSLPRAVRVDITHKYLGVITRLIPGSSL